MITIPEGNVVEAHLSTGNTVALRRTTAASGNEYFGTLLLKKDGTRKYTGRGVNVAVEQVGHPDEQDEIVVLGMTIHLDHDKNDAGNPRAKGSRTFTADDGEEWVFSYRSTLIPETAKAPAVCNTDSTIRRKGGGGGFTRQVQSGF